MSRYRAIRMNHHPYLEQPFLHRLNRLNHLVHHHCVPAAVGSVPAAVRGTLKAVGVLEHHHILCQHGAYLVAVAVATHAAILDSRNYQERVLHSFAGVAEDRYGSPVGYLGIRRQNRIEAG
jgi:hypothetical protein